MNKTAYGFEVETTEHGIRISQNDLNQDAVILIAPEQVDMLVTWLQEARDESSPVKPRANGTFKSLS